MGLFDIFKRRSKKNEKKQEKEQQQETQKSSKRSSTETESNQTIEDTGKVTQASREDTSDKQSQTSKQRQVEAPTNDSQESANRSVPQVDDRNPSDNVSQASSEVKPEIGSNQNESTKATEKSQSGEPDQLVAKESSRDHPESVPASQDDEQKKTDEKVQRTLPTVDEAASPAEKHHLDDEEASSETTSTQSYERGLEKSRSSFGAKLNALLANFRHVDESFFDDLEDMLIESDVGFDSAIRITDELREEVKLQNAKKSKDVQNVIVKKLIDMYDAAGNGENASINMAKSGPTVILMVGVNGVGKTTTIGKMAKMYKDQGKKVVLAAADTFRAGAIEQLNVWAERDGVDIVKGKPKSDPSSVVFDAVKKARDESYDILMVDTAGRLQNKVNLMNELSKMKKILTREIPEAPHEVLLVLDATTGQNAMTQAKMFKEATDVTGIVLTKLDGTAKGGIVLAIRSELHLPVKYVGLGEKVTDLKPFDPNDFVYGLFKGLISE